MCSSDSELVILHVVEFASSVLLSHHHDGWSRVESDDVKEHVLVDAASPVPDEVAEHVNPAFFNVKSTLASSLEDKLQLEV